MKKFIKVLTFLLLVVTFFCYYSYSINNFGPYWSYSFCYNIAKGFIPYRDFNMIITPFYPVLLGLIMHIINNSFTFFLLLNSIISSLIVYEVYKKKEEVLLVILLLLFIAEPGYNLFLIYLYYLIIKYKDSKYMLGLLTGILFLTKQNIGFIFLLIMLYGSKDKIKNSISFLITITISFIYLFINSALSEFVSQSFLGLLNFGKNNLLINISLPIILFILIFMIYKIIKNKFKNIELIYILGFILIAFPVFDFQHIGIALLPFLSYYASKYKHYNKYVFYVLLLVLDASYINYSGIVPNKTHTLKYAAIDKDLEAEIINVVKDINENKEKEIFLISGYAPIYKIENDMDPSIYDLLNKDNLGYKGTSKYLKYVEKTCMKKKCHFILSSSNWQIDSEIIKYIVNNYNFIKEKEGIYIYEN